MSLNALTGSSGADALDDPPGAGPAADPGPANRPGLAILLAEHDAAQAARLQKILRNFGHSVVHIARDGQEACLICQRTKPGLALISQTLPKMDGLQAAFVIKRNQPLPVVLMVSRLKPRLANEAIEAGVDACVFKPVEPDLLARSLEIAHENFLCLRNLENQIQDLRQEIITRKLMGRASGILMKRLNLSQEQAIQRLHREAQTKGIALAEVAQGVIAAQKITGLAL